jgi:hypothetical protein
MNYNSGHYPLSCLLLKVQRFVNWILHSSAGGTQLGLIGRASLCLQIRETSFIYWDQLSRFYVKVQTESNLTIVMFQIRDRMMHNVYNCDSYINDCRYEKTSKLKASFKPCSIVGWGTMLQAGKSLLWVPMRSLNLSNLPKPSSRTRSWGLLSF